MLFARCSKFPVEEGFLHKFVVKKPIDNIAVISSYVFNKEWTDTYLENHFCNSSKNKFGRPINGIAIFYPRKASENELATTGNDVDANYQNNDNIIFDVDIALCNPADYLDYQSTQSCISKRKLGDPSPFNQ